MATTKEGAPLDSCMFQYFAGTTADLVQLAKSAGSTLIKKVVSPISDRQLQDFHNAEVKVDKHYHHTIDSFSVSHALKKHGAEREVLRGQVPVTAADFEKVSDILDSYDKVIFSKNSRGQSIVQYSKQYLECAMLYVEEVRVGHKELAKDLSKRLSQRYHQRCSGKTRHQNTPEATLDFPFSTSKFSINFH